MVLALLTEPNPLLHKKSENVAIVNDEIKQLMDNMLEAMYYYHGVGLAAVQVGYLKKVIVIDVGEEASQGFKMPLFMINASITQFSEAAEENSEGCLSFPSFKSRITRPKAITVEYLDYHGDKKIINVENGLLSVCIQHEVDHTNGKVFVDYLPEPERHKAVAKVTKYVRKKPEWFIRKPHPAEDQVSP